MSVNIELKVLRKQIYRKKYFSAYLPLTLERVFSRNSIYETLLTIQKHNGKSPGLEQITIADISNCDLGEIAESISHFANHHFRQFKHGPVREVQIPKGEGRGYRTISVLNIADRVIGHLLNRALRPRYESVFLQGSIGFRRNVSIMHSIARVVKAIQEGSHKFAVLDIRDAFGSVPISITHKIFNSDLKKWCKTHFEAFGFSCLLKAVLLGSTHNKVGILQGNPLSPLALNVVLHNFLDIHLENFFSTLTNSNVIWLRYADDILLGSDNTADIFKALELSKHSLRKVRMSFKNTPNIFKIINLSDMENFDYLGYNISLKQNIPYISCSDKKFNEFREKVRSARAQARSQSYVTELLSSWLSFFAIINDVKALQMRAIQVVQEFGYVEFFINRIEGTLYNSIQKWNLIKSELNAD